MQTANPALKLNSINPPQALVDSTVAALEAWLETMRGPQGYGGPVAHWWQQSLTYTGPGFDWRYEGIITGYLHLWERSDASYLEKACRAADDLVQAQLPNGHFPASCFELNPATAGTPHEAACDVGLLRLAKALQTAGFADWGTYAYCAEQNIRTYYLAKLWDAEVKAFRDNPQTPSFVPNKAATACEALFLLAELSGDALWVEQYALPTLDQILAHQVKGGLCAGAIAQNSFGSQRVEKYFPIYISRCVPALIQGYRWTNKAQYAQAAVQAMEFIASWCAEDGSLPTVIYPNGQVNRNPTWIAPLAEVLHATDLTRLYGFTYDFYPTFQRLVRGQDASGGIQTARGFAKQAWPGEQNLPDVRDVLHVVGWCDKAFAYLASHAGPNLRETQSGTFETHCTFQGQTLSLQETPEILEIVAAKGVYYRWWKGAMWPEIAHPLFWLR